ncbi:MAG: repressor LexA [Acidobacteriota bacterium]|jgi:SOS-response transcriptional repressor LexA|nr:repressor LexA [Acidobacteriota bacterium]
MQLGCNCQEENIVSENLPHKSGRKRQHKPVSEEAARVGARITQARGKTPLTKVEQDLSISHQALSKIESGRSNPSDPRTKRTLMRLAEYYRDDFDLDWLTPYASGKKPAQDKRPKDNLLKFPDAQQVKALPIPIIGRIAAGEPIEAIEEDKDKVVYIAETELEGINNPRALRVVGDSMKGLYILHNDLVIIGDSSIYQNRIVAVYVIENGNYSGTLKRWKRRGRKVELQPANPKYKSKTFTSQSKITLEVFGVVFKLLRNYDYSRPLDSEAFGAAVGVPGAEGANEDDLFVV